MVAPGVMVHQHWLVRTPHFDEVVLRVEQLAFVDVGYRHFCSPSQSASELLRYLAPVKGSRMAVRHLSLQLAVFWLHLTERDADAMDGFPKQCLVHLLETIAPLGIHVERRAVVGEFVAERVRSLDSLANVGDAEDESEETFAVFFKEFESVCREHPVVRRVDLHPGVPVEIVSDPRGR